MAVGHVVRLLTQIAFLTFLLCPGNADQDQSECKAPTAAFLSSCTLVRRVLSRCHRVKSPIVVWSKHGRTAIILPDNQHSAGVDTVLLCGDIHPQPGPYTTTRRAGEENMSRPTKRYQKWTRMLQILGSIPSCDIGFSEHVPVILENQWYAGHNAQCWIISGGVWGLPPFSRSLAP